MIFELSPTDLRLGDFPQHDVLAHLTEHNVEAHLNSQALVADAPGALHAVSGHAAQCPLLGRCVRVSRLWSMGHVGRLHGNAASPERDGPVLPTQMGRDGKALWCHAGIWEGGQKCKRGTLCVCMCV